MLVKVALIISPGVFGLAGDTYPSSLTGAASLIIFGKISGYSFFERISFTLFNL